MIRAVHAEWTKLRTVPSTLWTVLSVVVGTVAIGAFATLSLSTEQCGERGTGCDTTRMSVTGVYLGQVAVVVLAVLALTPEYETSMIRTTLAADARRARVLAAKALVVTAIALIAGALSMLGSLLLGRIILSDKGFHAVSLGDGPSIRAYTGTVLYCGLLALLSLGIGAIMRHTGGTISVVIGLLLTPPILASLVTDPVWRERIMRVAPMTAGLAIQATTNLEALPITPWQGLGLLAGYAALAMLAGAMLFQKRDA